MYGQGPYTTRGMVEGMRKRSVETTDHPRAARPKGDRLEVRISQEQKVLLQQAAALTGRNLSDYVVSAALNAAEATLREQSVIMLSPRDSVRFVEHLLNPPEPSAALVRAAERYRQRLGE